MECYKKQGDKVEDERKSFVALLSVLSRVVESETRPTQIVVVNSR